MRSQLCRWLLTASLAGGTLLSVQAASAQPDVRDQRKGPKHNPRRDAPPNAPINAGPPREAPPEPRAERGGQRRGHVWVEGHWEWNNGKWDWQAGRFERERRGK